MSDTIETPSVTDPPTDPSGTTDGAVAGDPQATGTSWVPLLALVGSLVALGALVNWWLVVVIMALVVSILLHELGHFLVARRSGMKATEFFLGMGPRIWSVRRGETEYGLKAFPVGAYVRIIGMSNLEDVDPADEERTYRAKSYPKRLATVLAGPAMNLLIAFVVLYGVVLTQGPVQLTDDAPGDGWTVGQVVTGSAAASAGLQPGDEVVSVGGRAVGDWDGFSEIIDDQAGDEVEVVVIRDGEELVRSTTLGWALNATGAAAIPSSPDLVEGTLVLAVDDRPISSYDELAGVLATIDEPVTLRMERNLRPLLLEVREPVVLPDGGDRGFFGVGPEAPEREVGPLGALGETFSTMGGFVVGTGQALGELFSPSGLASYTDLVVDSTTEGSNARRSDEPALQVVEGDQASEVVELPTEPRPISILGIVRIGGDIGAEQGWAAVLAVLASVNLVLALINLVPLLPFDGGHAAVATYEAVRGAIARRPYRVDMAKLMPVTYAVVAVLMFVGLTSIWLDVRNPIQVP